MLFKTYKMATLFEIFKYKAVVNWMFDIEVAKTAVGDGVKGDMRGPVRTALCRS